MPFKKTKKGYVYDPKGNLRIPSKKNLFNNIIRYDPETGHPLDKNGKIDWARVIREKEQRGG